MVEPRRLSDECLTLIGDGIENPANAHAMLDVAGMFRLGCRFRDRKDLARTWAETDATALPCTTRDEVAVGFHPVVACETVANAMDVYGFKLPANARAAVLVGNERFGLADDMLALADHAVRIPLASRHLTSLNVAAASAVALYYLARDGSAPMAVRADPERLRPELLLIGGADHFELGSAIRSAAALGWERALILDRAAVWFGANRATRSEGRAAARRGRNPIRLVPVTEHSVFAFDRAVVVSVRGGTPTTSRRSGPLGNLAAGARHVVVVPDESEGAVDPAAYTRLAKRVDVTRLELPAADRHYRYRAVASIVMAEIARQVGRRLPATERPPGWRRPHYRSALPVVPPTVGEVVDPAELERY